MEQTSNLSLREVAAAARGARFRIAATGPRSGTAETAGFKPLAARQARGNDQCDNREMDFHVFFSLVELTCRTPLAVKVWP
jgi:hypothetical protein